MTEFVSGGIAPLLLLVLLPVLVGAVTAAVQKNRTAFSVLTIAYGVVQLIPAVSLFAGGEVDLVLPLTGGGLELSFTLTKLNSVFLLLTAGMFALLSVYTVGFAGDKEYRGRFMLYLDISLGMINGAMLSDNLAGMLFFWEGLLVTLFLILMIGNREKPATAVKALTISGTADLLLMAGIIITGINAGTLTVSQLHGLPLTGTGGLGFVLMFLGAVGKAGCMPFHSWIPDAADDAPLPFMAAFPGALEKLLGIYFSVRLVFEIYDVQPGGGMSVFIMILGVLTIVLAVAMALIQKDMKRLLAYHAVSQVGYMVLGIGTCLPVGVLGGLFHMINHVVYKSCLFMTAGAIEKRTGTTDARKLGGLGSLMPATGVCFIVAGLSISGVPPFNGFFSKELIFDAALESGVIFYIGALLGAIMTAISFLKLGHALFFGDRKLPKGVQGGGTTKKNRLPEAPQAMLLPMRILAVLCVLMGLFNGLFLDKLFGPAMGITESYSGWPHSALLVGISMAALLFAVADHVYGFKKTGSAIMAADHIHEAPVLRQIYALAEKKTFDPYVWLTGIADCFAIFCVLIEKGVSWFYDVGLVRAAKGIGNVLSRADNGHLSRYVVLALLGLLCIAAVFAAGLL